MKNIPSVISAALFNTKGQLTVKIIEVSCASFESFNTCYENTIGTSKSKRLTLSSPNRSSKPIQSAYITVDITLNTSENAMICQVASPPVFCSLLPQYGKGTCLIGEEFIFDHVISTSNLCLTLLFDAETAEVSPTKRKNHHNYYDRGILGIVDIPITRLESDKAVSQWYQLLHPATREGLKSAIRVEVLFSEDADGGLIPTPFDTSPIKRTSTYGTEKSEETSKTILNRTDIIDESDNDLNSPKPAIHHLGSDGSLEVPTVESKRLPTGLVDYVVIIGQEEKEIHCATLFQSTQSNNNSKDKFQKSTLIADSITSPQSTPISPTITNSRQSIVWDRFPKQDYPDNPLPDKIEWFVSPQGPETICSPTRPAYILSSFVLSAGDNSGQLYGIRLRYYLKAGRCEQCSISPPYFSTTYEQIGKHDLHNQNNHHNQWWLQPIEFLEAESSSQTNKPTDSYSNINDTYYKWISVDFSLLSRWSFIDQLSRCIEFLYKKILLPDLIQYEAKNIHLNSSSLSSEDSWHGHPHLTVNCDQVMIALCFECPAPVPGLYTVTMNLWGLSPSTPSVSMNIATPSTMLSGLNSLSRHNRPSFTIDFQLPPPNSLPHCPYQLIIILEILGSRAVIDILCCALSESRILFHSKDLSKLPIICECIVTLIYPLKWSHVYLPVVPASLLDLVEAPVPFMLGTHSSWLQYLSSECLNDVVVIDCDTVSIDLHQVTPLTLPDDINRWLSLSMKSILTYSHAPMAKEKMIARRKEACLQFQILIFDVLVALLKDVPQCLFYLDRNTPIFNRPLFLSEFTSEKYQKCVKILSDTNAFHRFTDALHTYGLQFFVECSDRFPLEDWMMEVEINPLTITIENPIDSPSEGSSVLSSSDDNRPSPQSESSPLTWVEQNYGVSTDLQSGTMLGSETKVIINSTPSHKTRLPFFPSLKKSVRTPKNNSTETTPLRLSNDHNIPIVTGNPIPGRPGIAPYGLQSPMQKAFHSSFRAKNLEDLIAATELESDSNTNNNSNGNSSANINTNLSSHLNPTLTRTLSRRLSFNRQKSWSSNRSFRLNQDSSTRSLDRSSLDNDLDVIFSDILDPNTQTAYPYPPSNDRSGFGIAMNPKMDNQEEIFDPTLPKWIFYGKNFKDDVIVSSTEGDSNTIDIGILLHHRIDLYAPYILRENINKDPVLVVDIFDASFDNKIGDEFSALSSTTRKKASSIYQEQTSASTANVESGRISIRKSKRFWNDSDTRLIDASGDDLQSDDSSSISSRPTSTSNAGSNHDLLVNKRLVLQRSSAVVGVSLNISYTESSGLTKEERRRSNTNSAIGSFATGSFGSGARESKYTPTKDSIEQLNNQLHNVTNILSKSEGSIDLPPNSSHSLESTGTTLTYEMRHTNDIDINSNSSNNNNSNNNNNNNNNNSTANSPREDYNRGTPDTMVGLDVHVDTNMDKSSQHDESSAELIKHSHDMFKPFTPVVFDYHRLTDSMNLINVWTLADLSSATGESIEELGKKYADTIEKDLCTSDFSIMYKNAAKSTKPDNSSSGKRRRNTISNRFIGSKQSSTQLSHWLDKSPAHMSCGASILDYLKIVISGLSVPEPEFQAVKQQCYEELRIWENRGSLLEILKQTHGSSNSNNNNNNNGSSSNSSGNANSNINNNSNSNSNSSKPIRDETKSAASSHSTMDEDYPSFFPLHSEAFKLMTILFQEILNLCTQQHDYLHAYDLLIAGGLYFNVGDKDEGIIEESDGYVEFLNSSIKHHPIYQKPELWIAVLKFRLDMNSSKTATPVAGGALDSKNNHSKKKLLPQSQASQQPPPSISEPNSPMSLKIDQVILETHAMLYMMHSLGVNPERAMLFIQHVVETYHLDLKFFMDLKLFLDRLWPSHRKISLITRDRTKSNAHDNRYTSDSDDEYDDPHAVKQQQYDNRHPKSNRSGIYSNTSKDYTMHDEREIAIEDSQYNQRNGGLKALESTKSSKSGKSSLSWFRWGKSKS